MSVNMAGPNAETLTSLARARVLFGRTVWATVDRLNGMEYRNVNNLPRLLEVLDESKPNYNRIVAFHTDHIRINHYPMGKLQEVAQRIADTRKKLEAEADKLAGKLDGLDAKAPAAFERGNAIIDQHGADIDAMDSELRQLSNLPLDK